MHIKSLTLNLLPYFMGIACFISTGRKLLPGYASRMEVLGAHKFLAKSSIVRLRAIGCRIKHAVPLANDKVPTPITPSPEIKNAFESSIQVG